MSTTIENIVTVTGTYTNKATGEDKKQYLTIGKLFTKEDGKQFIKIECLPTGAWEGFANIYPVERKSDKPKLASDTDPELDQLFGE